MVFYRAWIVFVLFFLLCIAYHQKMEPFSFTYILAFLSLFGSYATAASINDIADKDIDRVNHPGNKGRPLVVGQVKEKDMYHIGAVSAVLTIFFAFLINLNAACVMATSLILSYIYSMPPLKISHKPVIVPFFLSFVYVVLPYLLALSVIHENLSGNEYLFLFALYLLFFGRIILKDFRDRKGDAKYGKMTIVLKYGEVATCILSTAAIFIGNILLFLSFPIRQLALFFFFEVCFIFIYYLLYRLSQVNNYDKELRYIWLAAKVGNVILVALLGSLILFQEGVSTQPITIFAGCFMGFYIVWYLNLLKTFKKVKPYSYRA